MRSAPDRKRAASLAALLALITLALYAPVVRGVFTEYDDQTYVVENPHVNQGFSWAGLRWACTESHASNWHPLTWLSHMLDCAVFGLQPPGHYAVNLLLHLANTLLVFHVLRRLTGATWRAAAVAALFAWHPLHVESVAWIAERKDLLSAGFGLLTIGAYARYAAQPCRKNLLAALGFFTLGLMSKPMLVTWPFVLLLLDVWPLRRVEPDADIRKFFHGLVPLLKEKAPFFLLAMLSSGVTFWAQERGGAVAALEAISLPQRLANALVSYDRYLEKTFWPVNLAVIYPHPGAWPGWRVALAAALLAGITTLAWRTRRRLPFLAIGWFWYLGTLVPVIGLVQVGIQSMADRYTYLPLLGIFIALVWGWAEISRGWPARKLVLTGAAGGAVIVCLSLTHRQIRHWRDSLTLFTHAIAVTENNFMAHKALAATLVKANRVDEAVGHYETALRLNPALAEAHYDLGVVRARQGQPGEAARHYSAALRLRPDYPDASYNFGNLLVNQGRLAEAKVQFSAVLRQQPDHADAHSNLGFVLAGQNQSAEAITHYEAALRVQPAHLKARFNLGLALLSAGRFAEAAGQFSAALQIDPALMEARRGLGSALASQGKFAEAEPHLATLAARFPKDAAARLQLGMVLAGQGKFSAAVESLRAATLARPDWPPAMRALAWVLATAGDAQVRNGREALTLATRAGELTARKNPAVLDALAAAQAETGDFPGALGTIQEAINLADATGNGGLVQMLAEHKEAFAAGRPWREPAAR